MDRSLGNVAALAAYVVLSVVQLAAGQTPVITLADDLETADAGESSYVATESTEAATEAHVASAETASAGECQCAACQAKQAADLKAAVAGLGVNGGVKTALTVKLNQAASLLGQGKTAEAVSLLSADFIGQVNSLLSEGKLTQAEADALTTAAQETIQNINS